MSSDSESRPLPPKRRRVRSKKSTLLSSSDESDNPVLRTLRHRVVHKRSSGSEAAGTSQPVQDHSGKSEKPSTSTSHPSESQPVEPKRRSSRKPAAKSPKKSKEDVATSSKVDNGLDASDDQGEQCPICLIVFVNQEVASPSSCEHFFCFECLMKWSKNTNTCPVDRKTFNVIDVRPKFGDKVERHISVAVRTNAEESEMDQEIEDDTDDEFNFGLGNRAIMTGILRIAFPRQNSLSSTSSSSDIPFRPNVLDLLDSSSDILYSPDRSPQSDSEPAFSPVESEPPFSPSVINLLSSPSENEQSSPSAIHSSPLANRQLSSPFEHDFSSNSELRQASSGSDHRQITSDSDHRQASSDSENRQLSLASEDQQYNSSLTNSPSQHQQYNSSFADSPSVNEQPSSSSVKDESYSSEIEPHISSSSEVERYSSEKEESPSIISEASDDEKNSDIDSYTSCSSY